MKRILFIFLLCAVASTGFSQQPGKVVYAQLGGPNAVSLNYDMRFSKSESGIGGRIGFGSTFNLGADGHDVYLGIPAAFNYILPLYGKHFLEGGIGMVFFKRNYDYSDLGINNWRGSYTGTYGFIDFGYRYQPVNSHSLFRATISQKFQNNSISPFYLGLSFGYQFHSKK